MLPYDELPKLPPNQVPMTQDEWNRLSGQSHVHYGDIVPLRLSGASYAEISELTGISETSVRRVVEYLIHEGAN